MADRRERGQYSEQETIEMEPTTDDGRPRQAGYRDDPRQAGYQERSTPDRYQSGHVDNRDRSYGENRPPQTRRGDVSESGGWRNEAFEETEEPTNRRGGDSNYDDQCPVEGCEYREPSGQIDAPRSHVREGGDRDQAAVRSSRHPHSDQMERENYGDRRIIVDDEYREAPIGDRVNRDYGGYTMEAVTRTSGGLDYDDGCPVQGCEFGAASNRTSGQVSDRDSRDNRGYGQEPSGDRRPVEHKGYDEGHFAEGDRRHVESGEYRERAAPRGDLDPPQVRDTQRPYSGGYQEQTPRRSGDTGQMERENYGDRRQMESNQYRETSRVQIGDRDTRDNRGYADEPPMTRSSDYGDRRHVESGEHRNRSSRGGHLDQDEVDEIQKLQSGVSQAHAVRGGGQGAQRDQDRGYYGDRRDVDRHEYQEQPPRRSEVRESHDLEQKQPGDGQYRQSHQTVHVRGDEGDRRYMEVHEYREQSDRTTADSGDRPARDNRGYVREPSTRTGGDLDYGDRRRVESRGLDQEHGRDSGRQPSGRTPERATPRSGERGETDQGREEYGDQRNVDRREHQEQPNRTAGERGHHEVREERHFDREPATRRSGEDRPAPQRSHDDDRYAEETEDRGGSTGRRDRKEAGEGGDQEQADVRDSGHRQSGLDREQATRRSGESGQRGQSGLEADQRHVEKSDDHRKSTNARDTRETGETGGRHNEGYEETEEPITRKMDNSSRQDQPEGQKSRKPDKDEAQQRSTHASVRSGDSDQQQKRSDSKSGYHEAPTIRRGDDSGKHHEREREAPTKLASHGSSAKNLQDKDKDNVSRHSAHHKPSIRKTSGKNGDTKPADKKDDGQQKIGDVTGGGGGAAAAGGGAAIDTLGPPGGDDKGSGKKKKFLCFPRKKKGGGGKGGERNAKMEELKKEMNMDDHKIPFAELYERYKTDPEKGLKESQVSETREKVGKNVLTPPAETPKWLKFIKCFINGFALLMLVGGALCVIFWGIDKATNPDALTDNLWLGVSLFVVVFCTGLFQYFQEANASDIMESFKKMVPTHTKVFRDGTAKEMATEDLVPGDVVEMKGGDRVPADVRIIWSDGFKVDNSSLTGEPEAMSRSKEFTNDNPLETKNLAFYSTFAVEGVARGVVVKTGDRTVMGRIATLTTSMGQQAAPIAKEVNYFVTCISILCVFWGLVIFILALSSGYPFLTAVLFFISTVVANVPEAMIAEFTVLLAIAAKRMAAKNCLVRYLQAVETLGSTSVICSDKTGTLTQNRMTVSHLWYDGKIHDADMTGHIDHEASDEDKPKHSSGFLPLVRVAALCNRAEFKDEQKDKPIIKRECIGDASETALLKFSEMNVGQVIAWRQRNKKICEVPFNSTNKYQVSVHQLEDSADEGCFLLVMKGAPERILQRCGTYWDGTADQKIDDEFTQAFNDAYLTMGGMGERVLGFCDYVLPADDFPSSFQFETDPEPNFPLEGLRFLGLISMIDPPRPGVPDAVARCRNAHIRVTMVTGDHPITAKAIAQAVGIISESSMTVEDIALERGIDVEEVDHREATACVIHGLELVDMTKDELREILSTYEEIVFARTSPQQKLIIVEAYQNLGHYVAVTGDGVNDSPALKKADIGIAMGIAGSDVSKQASDMILMDDNFASIVTGVEEGRIIFDNMKKAITYVLVSNVAELLPFLTYVALNIPLALATVTMLCISVGTDFWPDISLAYEMAESDVMKRKPRNPHTDKLLNLKLLSFVYGQMGMIEALGCFFAYFVVLGENGFWPQDVFGIRPRWDNKALNNLEDSYGQEWTYANRKALEFTSNTAYFVNCVVIQWANLIVSKTRYNSIVTQGMGNWWLNFGLVFETVLAYVLVYTPYVDQALRLYPLKFGWWWPAVPFAVYFFVYDELRKFLIRRYPNSWLATEWHF